MDLFKKVDWFYKLAQDVPSSGAHGDPNAKDYDDLLKTHKEIFNSSKAPKAADTKPKPSLGYPYQSIRGAAKSALTRLISNQEVPLPVKKDLNNLGDYLRDYLNKRYTDEELNNRWEGYLTAIMDYINKTANAAAGTLKNFYLSLFDIFSNVWDDIAKSWTSKYLKPTKSPEAVEDPFVEVGAGIAHGDPNAAGANEEYAKHMRSKEKPWDGASPADPWTGKPSNSNDPDVGLNVADVKKKKEEFEQMKLRPGVKAERTDRMKKLSRLILKK